MKPLITNVVPAIRDIIWKGIPVWKTLVDSRIPREIAILVRILLSIQQPKRNVPYVLIVGWMEVIVSAVLVTEHWMEAAVHAIQVTPEPIVTIVQKDISIVHMAIVVPAQLLLPI